MLKGFRDFVVRGNVVDLAVGFVMGVAFTAVVTQFTASFLEPLVRVVSGGQGISAGTFTVRGVVFDWAAFLNAVVALLLTAATLYFLVVLPMNRLAERRRRGQEPEPPVLSEDVQLLTEIRDLLAAGAEPGPRSGPPQQGGVPQQGGAPYQGGQYQGGAPYQGGQYQGGQYPPGR